MKITWSQRKQKARDQMWNLYHEYRSAFRVLYTSGYCKETLLCVLIRLTEFDKSRFRDLRRTYYHPEKGYETECRGMLVRELDFYVRCFPEDEWDSLRMLYGPLARLFRKYAGTLTKEDRWREKCETCLQQYLGGKDE